MSKIVDNWIFSLFLMIMKMRTCFCGMAEPRKVFSHNSSQDHCRRFSTFRNIPPKVFFGKDNLKKRTPMPNRDFNQVAKQLYWNHTLAWVTGWSPVNLLHIFRTPFPKNTFRRLLMMIANLRHTVNKIWTFVKPKFRL